MRTSSRSRQAFACRSLIVICLSLFAGSPVRAADRATGVVVDQSGQPLNRALVRVADAPGGVFTNERGQFEIATPGGACRVEASLSGFTAASEPCGTAAMRIVLAVAPIRETTIVTATRTEAPASQVGASATVFSEADLETRQKPLMADLLIGTPGAMLVRSGQPGTVTSLFVRGGESDYNKILLDGVPLNEPGGTFFLSNLTTENLERVEIVRGAYSSLFGSDAMGSVIQLFTKRGDRSRLHPRVNAQIDGGTYGTLHTTAGVSGGAGRLDYSFGAARFDTDNRVPNAGFTNITISANAGVAVTPTAMLRFIARAERGHTGTPGPTAFGRPDLDAFSDRDDADVAATFDQLLGRVRQRASYSRAGSRQQSTNLIVDPPFRAVFQGHVATRLSTDFRGDTVNTLTRHHAGYQADVRLASGPAGDHLLTLLADWDGERADATNRLTPSRTVNRRDNFGFSAQQQMLWPRVFVTLGGRVERNDSFGTEAVPRGTVVYVLRQSTADLGETRVKASAGVGIKEPTMIESFSPSPFFRGNPNLKPERSRSAEVGIAQRFARDRAKVELTYFHNRFKDVITLISNLATSEGQFENVGTTRARGIELGAEARPVAAVQLRAGYSLVDSKVLASERPNDVLFGLGRPLVRRPRHSGSIGATLVWRRASVDVNGAFIGSFADTDSGLFSPSFTENPGHHTWDARIAWKLTAQLTGLLAIDNLTNQDYSEPLGYQPLLRAVRAGVRIGF